jgi:hypothetical protein
MLVVAHAFEELGLLRDYVSFERDEPDHEDVAMMISHDWWWLCLAAGVVLMASMTIGLILNGSLALD